MDDARLPKGEGMEQELARRFDDIDAALIEQRQYTEFAFDRLSEEMRRGFERCDTRFEQIDTRFEQIDTRFEQIDRRFENVEGRLDRIERKLDQFIDVQSTTNALVDRRLQALERKSARRQ